MDLNNFGLSICDKYYKKDMNEAEAMSLLNKIIQEVINIFLRRNILLYI